jgi:hypothetical protein
MSQSGLASGSGGGGGGSVLFLEGNTGGAIGPTGGGIINVVGAGTITVSGNAGTNTLTISNAEPAWVSISASQTMDPNVGYFCVSPGGALSLLLPPTSSQGDVISVALDGATSFTIAQGAGQSIVYGNNTTTVGVGGSISSTQQGDSLRLVNRIPNLRWQIVSSIGNPTIV